MKLIEFGAWLVVMSLAAISLLFGLQENESIRLFFPHVHPVAIDGAACGLLLLGQVSRARCRSVLYGVAMNAIAMRWLHLAHMSDVAQWVIPFSVLCASSLVVCRRPTKSVDPEALNRTMRGESDASWDPLRLGQIPRETGPSNHAIPPAIREATGSRE